MLLGNLIFLFYNVQRVNLNIDFSSVSDVK